MEPDAIEIRVLGCLLEKQRTTPDAYPLSLNALRLACNQSTNRDPVVDYDEETVRDALRRLALRGWTRLASGPGSRAPKYRQLFEEALGLEPSEAALLAVLMLRGPQTPGELKQRSDRLHPFADLGAVHETLERLIERGQVARLDRRPGQKEERYVQLLGSGEDGPAEEGEAGPRSEGEAGPPGDLLPHRERKPPAADADGSHPEERLDRLERELAELRGQVRRLQDALGLSAPQA